jgi:hypothetical protein
MSSSHWKILPAQPLEEGDEVSVGELLQIIQGQYAGLFVEVQSAPASGLVRVQTVGLRSLIVETSVPKQSLARDSITRRYLLGRLGYLDLQTSMREQQRREESKRERKRLVHAHRKALRKQLKGITAPEEKQALVEASEAELSRLLFALSPESKESPDVGSDSE